MRFAVSSVSLSREVSCHNLLHLYQRLAPALRTPDSSVPGLLEQFAKRKYSDLAGEPILQNGRYSHPWPAIVLQVLLKSGGDDEDYYSLYNDLMGLRLPTVDLRRIAQTVGLGDLTRGVPRFRSEHADSYIGLMADAVRWCGYKGWVILIDEVELVARLGKVGRLQAYQNLHWLLNWESDLLYPIYVLGAAAASLQDAWYLQNARRTPDREAIPRLAEERFDHETAVKMKEFFETAIDARNPTIGPAGREAVAPLLKRLLELHACAYAWDPPVADEWVHKIISRLPEDTKLRVYIRYALESLDQLLLTGEQQHVEVVPLQEPTAEEDEGFLADDSV